MCKRPMGVFAELTYVSTIACRCIDQLCKLYQWSIFKKLHVTRWYCNHLILVSCVNYQVTCTPHFELKLAVLWRRCNKTNISSWPFMQTSRSLLGLAMYNKCLVSGYMFNHLGTLSLVSIPDLCICIRV